MEKKVQFSLSGKAIKSNGEIFGKGVLKFETDPASMSLELDYKSKNKVVCTIAGTQGFKISRSSTLKLSETISKELFKKGWEGAFVMKLEISQSIAAQLTQEITMKGPKTIAEIMFRF